MRFASRVEFTSALMAFAAGSAAHARILWPMHACCLDAAGCLWPPGSEGNANQRRDQSALNAALAALAAGATAGLAAAGGTGASVGETQAPWAEPRCHRDKLWWAWAGHATVEPSTDPGRFDAGALRVFSRRAAEPKPYSPFVQQRTGSYVE